MSFYVTQSWVLTVLSWQISYSFKRGHTLVAEMFFSYLESEQADWQRAWVSAWLSNLPGEWRPLRPLPCFSPSNAMHCVILFKCMGKIRGINTVLTKLNLILRSLSFPPLFQMRKLEGIQSVPEIILSKHVLVSMPCVPSQFIVPLSCQQ